MDNEKKYNVESMGPTKDLLSAMQEYAITHNADLAAEVERLKARAVDLPSIEEVLTHASKYLYDRPGTDTDLYSLFRPQLEKIIAFAQGRK